jgi:Mlc titration factor MtfA (ptsG expression regulator)
MLATLRRLLGTGHVEVPAGLWERQLDVLPLLRSWPQDRCEQLRQLTARFLAQKSMTGVRGLELTAPMQLHIATQACVPVSRLGLHWYHGWSGIVVYPAAFRVRRTVHDADGIAHDLEAELTGEAWGGGPVVLSWEAAAAGHGAAPGGQDPAATAFDFGGNVVIHEFAHKLDLLDGVADGMPPFDPAVHGGLQRPHWQDTLEDALERFSAEVELRDSELPAHIDPDSAQADAHYASLPLDPYAATDAAEFFAVSSEAYFLRPEPLRAAFGQWFALLDAFYLGAGGSGANSPLGRGFKP